MFLYQNLPEWRDNFDKDNYDDDKPRSVTADDNKSYTSHGLSRKGSKYREPPSYDEFKDRYTEDDEYEKEWPDMSRRYSDDRRYSRDRDEPIYSNDSYYGDDDRYYDRDDNYGRRSDYGDRGYDRLSNKGSDTSYDSQQKLATNV